MCCHDAGNIVEYSVSSVVCRDNVGNVVCHDNVGNVVCSVVCCDNVGNVGPSGVISDYPAWRLSRCH